MSNQILYTAPGLNQPSGGVRVLYHHVELLRSSGYDAIVWEPADHTPIDWFDTNAKVLYGDSVQLDDSDIVVLPEVFVAEDYDPAPGCRKVIYNQGHFLTFSTTSLARYPVWDPIPAMWVSSLASHDVMQRLTPALPVDSLAHIPHGIDTSIFRPANERDDKIVWIPEKRPDEAQILYALFATDKRFQATSFKEVSRLTQQQTAAELGSASIFIALGHREGFGLPVAEALASGCVVIGYPAGGGKELFECAGTYAVQESDAVNIVETVAKVLQDPPTECERKSYRTWIEQKYSIHNQREALINAVETERAKPAKPGTATHPFLSVRHMRPEHAARST